MAKLTATAVKAALGKPGRHSDGDGLILAVGDKGNGSWMVRVQKDGKRRDIGLGAASKVTLSLARIRAAEAPRRLRRGLIQSPNAGRRPAPLRSAKQRRSFMPSTRKAGRTASTRANGCERLRSMSSPHWAIGW